MWRRQIKFVGGVETLLDSIKSMLGDVEIMVGSNDEIMQWLKNYAWQRR